MNCFLPPRLVLLALTLVGPMVAAMVRIESAPSRRWATSFDQPFSYQCPRGQALSFIHSVHDNSKEDRIWYFRCQHTPGTGDCRISDPANTWDSDMNFQCPRDEVIGGMAGVYNNKYKDRVFFFICCKTQVRLTGCTWTKDLNNFDGRVYHSLSAGKVFHGVYSRHSNHHEDRTWRFEVCDTAKRG